MARATAEVELGLKLSKKLTDAHSVPDAVDKSSWTAPLDSYRLAGQTPA
jgi:hypothetical protein